MDEARKRQIIRAWKLRKPDYGVISFRCTATGETFLAAVGDTKRAFNRHLFQLDMHGHPNRRLQELWDAYGRGGFELAVAAELEYDDPTADQTGPLRELLETCLEEHEGAELL